MARDVDSESYPSNVKNLVAVVFQILFPVVASWMGFKAIVEQKASVRLKSSSSSGRVEWMFGKDAVEFGIGLVLFAIAAHVIVYKKVLPERYHTTISWISRVAACAGLIFWCLSSF